MNTKIINITLPHHHDKHERRGRTCRNCILSYCEQDHPGTFCEIDEQPARNTRARAVKCKSFLHFRESLFFKALTSKPE